MLYRKYVRFEDIRVTRFGVKVQYKYSVIGSNFFTRLLLLHFWSNFDQTWYVSSLGQYASELCSNKKLDHRGHQERHLRGKIMSNFKTLLLLQILGEHKTNWIFTILITCFIRIVFSLKTKRYSGYSFWGQSSV